LSSTRPANHHRVKSAGDSAGQPLNRVFGRHKIAATIPPTTELLSSPPCIGSVGRSEVRKPAPLPRSRLACTKPKKSPAIRPQHNPPIVRYKGVFTVPNVKTLAAKALRRDRVKSRNPRGVCSSRRSDEPAGVLGGLKIATQAAAPRKATDAQVATIPVKPMIAAKRRDCDRRPVRLLRGS